ncbi:MAG: 1-acyl-sn-glycerol-3-phosphate acyltransferase [Cyanobacteriota bacterium]|nr:1-acyl-sn-glycerol-3-phosphate acyltransferase [Cyanobacteriota bacterium]
MSHVRPPLQFIPSNFNPLVFYATRALLPLLLRVRLRPWLPVGIDRVETANVETLVDLYRQFQGSKIRLLIAFRHPQVDDPFSMFHLVTRAVPQIARQQGKPLQNLAHSHFIYDRGMTIWAGDWLGWYFSGLGGSPIHRGKKLDWSGMRAARDLLLNGRFPLSVAPEGATNGRNAFVSPLEPGVAQLAFWCVEDLFEANRNETVVLVPIALEYRYRNPPWHRLDKLLSQLEKDVGLPVEAIASGGDGEKGFAHRLLRLGEQFATQMEQFYTRFYRRSLASSPDSSLSERLKALLDASLQVSEEYLGLSGKGTVVERCRWIENAGWNWTYREELKDLSTISPLERGLADWVARETELRVAHMRLVEGFVAVSGSCEGEKIGFESLSEIALILFDAIARLKGKTPPRRPRLGWRSSKVTVGQPICVSDRWPQYQKGRRAAKGAIADLTRELQEALEKMI